MALSFARSLLAPLAVALWVIAPSAPVAASASPQVPFKEVNAGTLGEKGEAALDAPAARNEAGELVILDGPTEPEGAGAAGNVASDGTSETPEASSAAPEESSAASEESSAASEEPSAEPTADEESTDEESSDDE